MPSTFSSVLCHSINAFTFKNCDVSKWERDKKPGVNYGSHSASEQDHCGGGRGGVEEDTLQTCTQRGRVSSWVGQDHRSHCPRHVRVKLTRDRVPGGPFANHRRLRPLHPCYPSKRGQGEARSRAGYLEEKDLHKDPPFKKIKARGAWNYCDMHSYLFQSF